LFWFCNSRKSANNDRYNRRKKTPQEGFLRRAKKNYFLTQAGFFSFSFFEQSTFLSSILPPPWLPAKAGADISMKAETRAVITIFIETPSGNEVVKKIQVLAIPSTRPCYAHSLKALPLWTKPLLLGRLFKELLFGVLGANAVALPWQSA
jgi:hypothetical protein